MDRAGGSTRKSNEPSAPKHDKPGPATPNTSPTNSQSGTQVSAGGKRKRGRPRVTEADRRAKAARERELLDRTRNAALVPLPTDADRSSTARNSAIASVHCSHSMSESNSQYQLVDQHQPLDQRLPSRADVQSAHGGNPLYSIDLRKGIFDAPVGASTGNRKVRNSRHDSTFQSKLQSSFVAGSFPPTMNNCGHLESRVVRPAQCLTTGAIRDRPREPMVSPITPWSEALQSQQSSLHSASGPFAKSRPARQTCSIWNTGENLHPMLLSTPVSGTTTRTAVETLIQAYNPDDDTWKLTQTLRHNPHRLLARRTERAATIGGAAGPLDGTQQESPHAEAHGSVHAMETAGKSAQNTILGSALHVAGVAYGRGDHSVQLAHSPQGSPRLKTLHKFGRTQSERHASPHPRIVASETHTAGSSQDLGSVNQGPPIAGVTSFSSNIPGTGAAQLALEGTGGNNRAVTPAQGSGATRKGGIGGGSIQQTPVSGHGKTVDNAPKRTKQARPDESDGTAQTPLPWWAPLFQSQADVASAQGSNRQTQPGQGSPSTTRAPATASMISADSNLAPSSVLSLVQRLQGEVDKQGSRHSAVADSPHHQAGSTRHSSVSSPSRHAWVLNHEDVSTVAGASPVAGAHWFQSAPSSGMEAHTAQPCQSPAQMHALLQRYAHAQTQPVTTPLSFRLPGSTAEPTKQTNPQVYTALSLDHTAQSMARGMSLIPPTAASGRSQTMPTSSRWTTQGAQQRWLGRKIAGPHMHELHRGLSGGSTAEDQRVFTASIHGHRQPVAPPAAPDTGGMAAPAERVGGY